MPVNAEISTKQWYRYAWVRDTGHLDYVQKHDKCERYFRGDQWALSDKAALNAIRRPALTINKIISTVSNVMGEQIYNRAETSFQPRRQSTPESAGVMAKVYKVITDQNQWEWKRSDMFADGIIGSRGFVDIRMKFDESLRGDVVMENMNPKNVLIDPDADQYDPDTWNEIFISKWLTVDDIDLLYSSADAKELRGRGESAFPYGYDSIDSFRDRFGSRAAHMQSMYGFESFDHVTRYVRVIERQYRKMDRQDHFVYPVTGETRAVPTAWDQNRVQVVAKEFGLKIIKKLVKRIRWTITADNVLLHDDWSPYKHFTIVPYFPYFRYGNTIGLVENLLDPQELLNKSSSQELHIVNTTANSGYKVRSGALTNMSIEELEERGAETGLVIEVNGEPEKDVVKIQPNNVPQGLDRVSFKAEDHIDKISGVNASMKGEDREDVAAKAIQAKKKSGSTNLVKPMDSLTRTDFIVARNVLDLIQEFMTTEQVMTIVKDSATGETEQFTVNQMDPATGEIANDLTVGEYGIVVTSVPHRESLEDSEFEQMVTLRTKVGIKIPDEQIIAASRLRNKLEIIRNMQGDKNTPEAKKQAEQEARAREAQVRTLEGEAKVKDADASLRGAKAIAIGDETRIKAHEATSEPGGTPGLDVAEADREHARKDEESAAKIKAMHEESNRKRDKDVMDAQIKAKAAADKAANDRIVRLSQPQPEEQLH
jgi:hypothetical protein